jgi:hypothetical protein
MTAPKRPVANREHLGVAPCANGPACPFVAALSSKVRHPSADRCSPENMGFHWPADNGHSRKAKKETVERLFGLSL